MHDPISDLLTRIRNAGLAQHAEVVIPHSKMKESISHILKDEGYISSVTVEGTGFPIIAGSFTGARLKPSGTLDRLPPRASDTV